MGGRLAELVVTRAGRVLLVALLIGAAVTPLVLRLRLDTNLVDLIPENSPGAQAFARYTRTFSDEQVLAVLVEGSDPSRLTEFADRYATAMRAVPGVVEVRARLGKGASSLVREHLLALLDEDEIDALAARVTPEALKTQAHRLRSLLAAPGGSSLGPLLTVDPLELVPLLGKRLQAGLPVDTTSGYFKSTDGQALVMFVRPSHNPFNVEADRALIERAGREALALGARLGDGDFEHLTGAPAVWFTGPFAYALEYRDWLHRDMQVSTLVSAVTVLVFFALLLGALRALPMVALPLLFGLWLTAGAAGAIYGRVNAVSLAFGTILISIGIDLPIQLYNRLREELGRAFPDGLGAANRAERRAGAREAIRRTIANLASPSLVATLGPAVVFFACMLSNYRGLAELGVLAGLGLLINWVTMLTVLPSLLALLPASFWVPRRKMRAEGAWFAWLGRRASRRPRWVLATVGLLTLASLPAVLRVHYDRRLISIEPPGLRAAQVTHELERRMGGRQNLLIALVEDRDPDRALDRAGGWRREAERLRKAGLLASYESLSNLFPSLAEQGRRRARIERMNPVRVAADLRVALDEAGLDVAAFTPFLRQLAEPPPPLRLEDAGTELAFLVANHVHDDASGRMVTTFLFPVPGRVAEVVEAVERFTASSPAAGAVTGVPILEAVLRKVVERDTITVTATSVAAVIVLLALYYRRVRPVLAILGPLSVAWILFAAALGAFGLPLNLFNLLSVPLVVGYGIDDHIFLVHRHCEHPELGPEHALASTGRAIVVTSLSTIAGFAGLAVARFDGLRLLGMSGALAVALCLLAAFAVLPALLAVLWPRDHIHRALERRRV